MNNKKTDKKTGRGKRKISGEIAHLTAGLGVTALDLVVLTAALGGGFLLYGPRGKDLYASYKTKNALRAAETMFARYQRSRFRQALGRAVNRGYLAKEKYGEYELTNEGKKRLSELLPAYKRPQPWDGQLWLVTYDIPEKRRIRKFFQAEIERIGCGKIQKSVWLSVKDPRHWLKDFVVGHNLQGYVIISRLGKDSSVGEEDVNSLVYRVFKIRQLEKRYRGWLESAAKAKPNQLWKLALPYLGILRIDPILPSELLPAPWVGDKDRKIFDRKIAPVSGNLASYIKGWH